jgi:hypothetical protein
MCGFISKHRPDDFNDRVVAREDLAAERRERRVLGMCALERLQPMLGHRGTTPPMLHQRLQRINGRYVAVRRLFCEPRVTAPARACLAESERENGYYKFQLFINIIV